MQGKCKDTKILLFNKHQLTYKRNKHTNIEFEGQKTASNRFIACSFVVYKYQILSSSNTLMSFLSIILRLPTASINGT